MKEYIEFLKDKMAISHQTGFEVNPDELTPSLYPHVKDTVRWAVSGGCRAYSPVSVCRKPLLSWRYFG